MLAHEALIRTSSDVDKRPATGRGALFGPAMFMAMGSSGRTGLAFAVAIGVALSVAILACHKTPRPAAALMPARLPELSLRHPQRREAAVQSGAGSRSRIPSKSRHHIRVGIRSFFSPSVRSSRASELGEASAFRPRSGRRGCLAEALSDASRTGMLAGIRNVSSGSCRALEQARYVLALGAFRGWGQSVECRAETRARRPDGGRPRLWPEAAAQGSDQAKHPCHRHMLRSGAGHAGLGPGHHDVARRWR